jgi:hypothetical protein
MTPSELMDQCRRQLELAGTDAKVMLSMEGCCNKRMMRQFAPGGPVGRINGDDMSRFGFIVVFFGAQELLTYLEGIEQFRFEKEQP